MSRPAKVCCEKCGGDVTISGSQICPICDPDIMKIITRSQSQKTPTLCDRCFQAHVATHGEQEVKTSCPNCNEPGYGTGDLCASCGYSPPIAAD